ncbi:MAG: ATP-dependent protease subunit HslV [Vicinamibacteria bacterium]|nr:ATP-dependent protease subunit HslV [Vicinamibacteria bacterium]
MLGVRLRGQSAIAGDGQVSHGATIVKHTARKIRRLHGGRVLAGFAGSTADAMSLFSKFEAKIEEYHGQLDRAAVELAKEWRTDRILRRLEAFLVVMDQEAAFLLSGAGDVITPDDGVLAVGSGGPFALAAARALVRHTDLDAGAVAAEALRIAAGICVYTNEEIVVETL